MKPYSLVSGLSALLVIFAAFMPWAKLGFIKASGTDGDGVITLVLGLIVGVIVLVTLQRANVLAGFSIAAAGALVVIIATYDIVNISNQVNDPDNPFASSVSVGEGLYATLVGGIGLIVGGLMTVAVPPYRGQSSRKVVANFSSSERDTVDLSGNEETGPAGY